MDKISTFIGFAIKSNKIVKGLDDLEKTKKRVQLVLYTTDLNENSKQKLDKLTSIKKLQTKEIDPKLLTDINIIGVKVLGITDVNLASAINKLN